jgi:glycosyltransferase involved in cell wall biosynthesis
MFFSIIIPLYNRPQEIKELLETLTLQTYKALRFWLLRMALLMMPKLL